MICLLIALLGAPLADDGAHPDFTGTWKLDLAASESLDSLLEAQGRSWLEREAARHIEVTQTITLDQGAYTVVLDSLVVTRTSVLRPGTTGTSEADGQLQEVSTRWSSDGQQLVNTTSTRLPDGTPAVAEVRWELSADGHTLTKHISLEAEGGKAWAAARVFRREP